MKKILFLILANCFVVNNVCVSAMDINRLWNVDNLSYAKTHGKDFEEAINKCIKEGVLQLSTESLAVVNKKKTYAPNLHYYCSMSPYYWPELQADGSIKFILKDGQSNPEAINYNRWSLGALSARLSKLALAFFFSEDKSFYDAFIDQIDVWFLNSSTKMYPNFDYAQVVPEMSGNRGTSAGIIEATPLITIIESICLVDSCKSIGYFRRIRIERWFRNFMRWMLSSDLCKNNLEAKNNIGTSFNVTMLRIAMFVNAKELVQQLSEAFPTRVMWQIEEDGKQPLELSRTKAYHYSTQNIRFIVEFCTIANSGGYSNVYEQCEGRIKQAVSYLSGFVGKEDTFPYKQLTDFKVEEKTLATQVLCIRNLDGIKTHPRMTNDVYDLIQCYVY